MNMERMSQQPSTPALSSQERMAQSFLEGSDMSLESLGTLLEGLKGEVERNIPPEDQLERGALLLTIEEAAGYKAKLEEMLEGLRERLNPQTKH